MAEEPLGQRIKKARLQRGWSQARMAEALGIDPRTVLRWEIKNVLPQLEMQHQLIELFGFEARDFQRPAPPAEPAPSAEEATPEPEEAPHPVSELEQMLPPKEDFKLYCGKRIRRHGWETTYVTVNGRPLAYFGSDKRDPEKQKVFEWGYGGAGPRDLAQSILANYLGERYPEPRSLVLAKSNALLFELLFKEEIIAGLPGKLSGEVEDDYWQISSNQIRRWFYSLEAEGITRTTLLESIYGKPADTAASPSS